MSMSFTDSDTEMCDTSANILVDYSSEDSGLSEIVPTDIQLYRLNSKLDTQLTRLSETRYKEWVKAEIPEALRQAPTLPERRSVLPPHAIRYVDWPALGVALPVSTHPYMVSGHFLCHLPQTDLKCSQVRGGDVDSIAYLARTSFRWDSGMSVTLTEEQALHAEGEKVIRSALQDSKVVLITGTTVQSSKFAGAMFSINEAKLWAIADENCRIEVQGKLRSSKCSSLPTRF